jgi:hypothetical protein
VTKIVLESPALANLFLPGAPLEFSATVESTEELPGAAPALRFEAREFSGFAVLPEAAAKRHAPEEIPFTSRNWDNRVKDYVAISDRLGLRVIGLRSEWAATPPYAAEGAPQD